MQELAKNITSPDGVLTQDMLDMVLGDGCTTTLVSDAPPLTIELVRASIERLNEIKRQEEERKARLWRMVNLYGVTIRDCQMPIMNSTL